MSQLIDNENYIAEMEFTYEKIIKRNESDTAVKKEQKVKLIIKGESSSVTFYDKQNKVESVIAYDDCAWGVKAFLAKKLANILETEEF